MGIRKVNLLELELDESLDTAGFRHRAASIGGRLGARRVGAGVYQAEAGRPIWPYHYHHGIEEWLYVLAGAPVLREPAGRRTLAAGDLVCFPSGHAGAHTVEGPGRFAIFDAGRDAEPHLSVYPDSDKVSGPQGILLRSSAVGYWHGEGTAGAPAPVELAREPETSPPRPVTDVLTMPLEPGEPEPLTGARHRSARVGGERLDAEVVALEPGEGFGEYAYAWGRERWLLVLAGEATVRHPEGEDALSSGDIACFPEGPSGAHRVANGGEEVVRALFLTTTGLPVNVCHPDSGRWLLRNGPGEPDVTVAR